MINLCVVSKRCISLSPSISEMLPERGIFSLRRLWMRTGSYFRAPMSRKSRDASSARSPEALNHTACTGDISTVSPQCHSTDEHADAECAAETPGQPPSVAGLAHLLTTSQFAVSAAPALERSRMPDLGAPPAEVLEDQRRDLPALAHARACTRLKTELPDLSHHRISHQIQLDVSAVAHRRLQTHHRRGRNRCGSDLGSTSRAPCRPGRSTGTAALRCPLHEQRQIRSVTQNLPVPVASSGGRRFIFHCWIDIKCSS